MKAPSLLVRCFPGLLPSKDTSCVPIVSEKDLQLPSLAVEIIPSKVQQHSLPLPHTQFLVIICILDSERRYFFSSFAEIVLNSFFPLFIIPSNLFCFQSAHPYKYAGEKVDVQGFDIFKVSSEYSLLCLFRIWVGNTFFV
jgi:hypothetical protein